MKGGHILGATLLKCHGEEGDFPDRNPQPQTSRINIYVGVIRVAESYREAKAVTRRLIGRPSQNGVAQLSECAGLAWPCAYPF